MDLVVAGRAGHPRLLCVGSRRDGIRSDEEEPRNVCFGQMSHAFRVSRPTAHGNTVIGDEMFDHVSFLAG